MHLLVSEEKGIMQQDICTGFLKLRGNIAKYPRKQNSAWLEAFWPEVCRVSVDLMLSDNHPINLIWIAKIMGTTFYLIEKFLDIF